MIFLYSFELSNTTLNYFYSSYHEQLDKAHYTAKLFHFRTSASSRDQFSLFISLIMSSMLSSSVALTSKVLKFLDFHYSVRDRSGIADRTETGHVYDIIAFPFSAFTRKKEEKSQDRRK